MALVAAIVAAIAGAMSFAVSAILEQRATKQVPDRGVFAPRLLLDLAKRPVWIASIVATIIGVALQVTALHLGPLALVQPILVLDLLFAVLFAAALRRSPPDRIIFAGVVCCAAGIAVFLAVAEPTGGDEYVSLPNVIPLAAILAGILTCCLIWARAHRHTRALALALAAGVCYGVNAFLLKLVSFSLEQGFSQPLTQWPLYALVILGPVGFLLNQEAFQAGTLISPVLAVMTTTTSLVSISIAYFWLDESLARQPIDVALEVISLAVMTTGIVLLARRAPAVASQRGLVTRAGGTRPAAPSPSGGRRGEAQPSGAESHAISTAAGPSARRDRLARQRYPEGDQNRVGSQNRCSE
jgi:drug/metabolite transporter (DMT)-like permease